MDEVGSERSPLAHIQVTRLVAAVRGICSEINDIYTMNEANQPRFPAGAPS